MCQRSPIQCIIPPYITEFRTRSADAAIRNRAIANLVFAESIRAVRATAQAMPALMAAPSPQAQKHRLIYDAQNTSQLPGTLVRSEGNPPTGDQAVDEAYDYSGNTYDFYAQLFNRNSLDDKGMTLLSTVHVTDNNGDPLDNAFWNGRQMAYGDGDGIVFQRFTQSLDVVAHELTHGVQSFTSNLTYQGQSGALNEHFSDVFGILVRQWINGETVEAATAAANWVIGREIITPAPTRRGIRDMEHPGTAYRNDPDIGNDPQPADMAGLYIGSADSGGVHINSGIPNRAFVLTAQAIGGNAWDVTGRIWYETLLQLSSNSQFADCKRISIQVAGSHGAAAVTAVTNAWNTVGV